MTCEGSWHISADGEMFDGVPYETRALAVLAGEAMAHAVLAGTPDADNVLADGPAPKDGALSFYVGRERDFHPLVDAETVIWQQADAATSFAGEYAEDWLCNVTDEDYDLLERRLTEAFASWMRETGNEPWFYVLADVERVSTEGSGDGRA